MRGFEAEHMVDAVEGWSQPSMFPRVSETVTGAAASLYVNSPRSAGVSFR
jgi:hypothetical protein